jgi:hypothetical protein
MCSLGDFLSGDFFIFSVGERDDLVRDEGDFFRIKISSFIYIVD